MNSCSARWAIQSGPKLGRRATNERLPWWTEKRKRSGDARRASHGYDCHKEVEPLTCYSLTRSVEGMTRSRYLPAEPARQIEVGPAVAPTGGCLLPSLRLRGRCASRKLRGRQEEGSTPQPPIPSIWVHNEIRGQGFAASSCSAKKVSNSTNGIFGHIRVFRLHPSGVRRRWYAFEPVVSLRSTTGYSLATPPAQPLNGQTPASTKII